MLKYKKQEINYKIFYSQDVNIDLINLKLSFNIMSAIAIKLY